MKEFIEKLIGRLEEYKDSHLVEHDSEQCEHCVEKPYNDCEGTDCTLCVWDKAIEIVNELAEEYKQDIDVPTIDVSELFGENKIVTNADRIRSMSDEELHDFIRAIRCCTKYGDDCGYPYCHSMKGNLCNGIKDNNDEELLNWLQSEAE